ncbi:MAG: hypothetical protein KC983_05525 [Phycisphaerales bacterium]|nr:hypothetical protein [Phycisphaerales bacterium]
MTLRIPENVISRPLGQLQNIIAASAAFQAFVAAADANEAKLKVHLLHEPAAQAPYALVGFASNWTFGRATQQSQSASSFASSGTTMLKFVADTVLTTESDLANEMLGFSNTIGLIIEEMVSVSGTNGLAWIAGIYMTRPPQVAAIGKEGSKNRRMDVIFGIEFKDQA